MGTTPHGQDDNSDTLYAAGGQRYYFDTDDGERLVRDDEGLVLGSLEEAKKEAVTALPHMARDGLPDGDYREFVVEVRDEAGRKVWTARLTLVVEAPSDAE
jgi:hypothetical protein